MTGITSSSKSSRVDVFWRFRVCGGIFHGFKRDSVPGLSPKKLCRELCRSLPPALSTPPILHAHYGQRRPGACSCPPTSAGSGRAWSALAFLHVLVIEGHCLSAPDKARDKARDKDFSQYLPRSTDLPHTRKRHFTAPFASAGIPTPDPLHQSPAPCFARRRAAQSAFSLSPLAPQC